MKEIQTLQEKVHQLIRDVRHDAKKILSSWKHCDVGQSFEFSAENLAHYLAFRHHDLRALQRSLMAIGLSSLGRAESRVLPTLEAVNSALSAIAAKAPPTWLSEKDFFAGERLLEQRTRNILGNASKHRTVAILVTCPSEAADDPAFILNLAERGIEALRINCAHDDADAWLRMIGHVQSAAASTGHRLKIFMDLAGPKIRTGGVRTPEGKTHILNGDLLAVVGVGKLDTTGIPETSFVAECSLSEALREPKAGHHLFIDDGKLCAVIEHVEKWGISARVTNAPEKGFKLKPGKGLNLPDTDLTIGALTDKDREDLKFVARHADGIEYSFVQSAADVATLQEALAELRPDDWQSLSIVLKIETPLAVRNLPEIVVRSASKQPTAIMIARGDLAVEIGFARLAEMQEEILWIGEAAHTPVIWATQVLEHLIQKGFPSRGEMTDAAMAARAECIMLNKGPHLLEAIDSLDTLLARMGADQRKKTPILRRLRSW